MTARTIKYLPISWEEGEGDVKIESSGDTFLSKMGVSLGLVGTCSQPSSETASWIGDEAACFKPIFLIQFADGRLQAVELGTNRESIGERLDDDEVEGVSSMKTYIAVSYDAMKTRRREIKSPMRRREWSLSLEKNV